MSTDHAADKADGQHQDQVAKAERLRQLHLSPRS